MTDLIASFEKSLLMASYLMPRVNLRIYANTALLGSNIATHSLISLTIAALNYSDACTQTSTDLSQRLNPATSIG